VAPVRALPSVSSRGGAGSAVLVSILNLTPLRGHGWAFRLRGWLGDWEAGMSGVRRAQLRCAAM
jgi:hypothetical protein